jgi:hypothetical protein
MKRKLAFGIVLAVAVLVFLPFCNLTFDLSAPPSSLNLTNALVVYDYSTDVQIQFSFTGEEDKHLCQYSVEKDGGTSFFLVDEGKVELLSGQVYKHTDISSYSYENGHYRFSISVLLERNGSYDSPPFLQDSVEFWIDPTGPSNELTFSVDEGSYKTAQQIELYHPELDTFDGVPASIFYTTNGSDPTSSSTLYVPGEAITIATDSTLKAVAIDLVGRTSEIVSASYIIDSIPPVAPDQPTSVAGPFINEDEKAAGFDVQVNLGTSGAQVGDELELLLNGSSFPTPLIRVLSDADLSAGCTFNIDSGQLGSDGDKYLTARVTDKAGNPGSTSSALTLTLDTTNPDPPSANPDSGTYSNIEVTLSHSEWPTYFDGTPVRLYYTVDGTTPDASSTEYESSPIGFPEGPTDLKSIAIDEAGNVSGVMIASYMIDTIAPVEPTTNPSWNAPRGESSSEFSLYFEHNEIPQTSSSATAVRIFYSMDPINPPDPYILFDESDPPSISANTNVKVVAIDETGNRSDVITYPYTFIKIDDIDPPACPLNLSMSFFDLSGFFSIFFESGLYVKDSAEIYIYQGSAMPVKCVIVNISSTERHLIVGIDGEQLLGNGMVPGAATITVINPLNSDSDSRSFLLE